VAFVEKKTKSKFKLNLKFKITFIIYLLFTWRLSFRPSGWVGRRSGSGWRPDDRAELTSRVV
jgi:hypothetical protein